MTRSALVPFKPPSRQEAEAGDVDFAVSIKVRNGRFLAALRRAGYRSVNAFCKAHGLQIWPVNDFVRMTRSPFHSGGDRHGRPLPLAQNIADILEVQVEDLFPPRFLATCLSRAARADDVPMTDDQIGMLIQQPPRTPEDVIAFDEAAALISDTLILLPPREERLLRLRYGMGLLDEQTLEETGKQVGGVSRERVRQMEEKALRRLRSPKRLHRLVQPASILCIGEFRVTVPRTKVTAAEAGIRELKNVPPPKKPPKKRELPQPETIARPLHRPVKFPEAKEPDFIRLLRIPEDQRSEGMRVALAYHLEEEFVRRGGGRLEPSNAEAAAMFAAMDTRKRQLAKYDWYMRNLRKLWQAFPPAPKF